MGRNRESRKARSKRVRWAAQSAPRISLESDQSSRADLTGARSRIRIKLLVDLTQAIMHPDQRIFEEPQVAAAQRATENDDTFIRIVFMLFQPVRAQLLHARAPQAGEPLPALCRIDIVGNPVSEKVEGPSQTASFSVRKAIALAICAFRSKRSRLTYSG